MRNIVITLVLLAITVTVSVMYFKNLNPPGQRSGKVMENIPAGAALIFEYKNDQSFYDLFKNNHLLSALIGGQKSAELDDLKVNVLDNPLLKPLFGGESLFISLHPKKNADEIDFLITTSTTGNINGVLEQIVQQKNDKVLVNTMPVLGKKGYNIYLNDIKRRFYLIVNDDDTFSASFSLPLVVEAAKYRNERHEKFFVQLSAQQNQNSIANLYVNYKQLSPLFDELFKSDNTDIFRSFRLLSAIGAFSLNYKSDALMFNGISHVQQPGPKSYLNVFRNQQPEPNELKNIFPATTAYSINFAVSDVGRFKTDLLQWQTDADYTKEKAAVCNRIKKEASIDLDAEFTALLGNEFAIITTRYQEKIALIQVKNGLDLRPFMVDISTMVNDDVGEFKYDKLPFFLLGDAFSIFRRPYFRIADNYLILCNSQSGLDEYYRNYSKGNFLGKSQQYIRFNNLQADKSNISFFINFKNAGNILKQELKPAYAKAFAADSSGWNTYYGAGYQFTASEKDFYTNIYMRLNAPDTTAVY